MRIRRASCALLVALFALAAGGCPSMPKGSPPPPSSSDGTLTLVGPLHAPGAGGSTNATEWTIETVRETVKEKSKQFLAVDVSGVQDQARSLDGQRVTAKVRMPTEKDAHSGRTGLRVVSIALAPAN